MKYKRNQTDSKIQTD